MTRTCEAPNCDQPLGRHRRPHTKYCNPVCAQAADLAARRARRVRQHRTCQAPDCSDPIPASRNKQAKYCSDACNRAAVLERRSAARRAARAKQTRPCANPDCQNTITRGNGLQYCTEACRPSSQQRRVVRRCTVCDQPMLDAHGPALYCGAACRATAKRRRDRERAAAPTITITPRPENETTLETIARLARDWPEFREAMIEATQARQPARQPRQLSRPHLRV